MDGEDNEEEVGEQEVDDSEKAEEGGQDEDAQVGEDHDKTHQHVLNKWPDDDGDDKKHQ